MAHSFDTSLYTTSNPFNYTCGTGTTLFVLGIHSVTGARAGGAPTYGGIPMTRVARAAFDYGEGSGELWYLISPSTGSAYSVSMQNTNNQTLYLRGSSYKAQDGSITTFDVSLWTNTTSTNPSHTISGTAGGVIVQMCSHEQTSLPSAYTDNRILPVDHGNNNSWMQYKLVLSTGNNTVGATQSSDEYVLITAAFKEDAQPLVGQKIYAWTGSEWKQAIPKVYTGTEWKTAIVKVYTGTEWKTI